MIPQKRVISMQYGGLNQSKLIKPLVHTKEYKKNKNADVYKAYLGDVETKLKIGTILEYRVPRKNISDYSKVQPKVKCWPNDVQEKRNKMHQQRVARI